MTMPAMPHSDAPEGADMTMGTNVDPDNARQDTAMIEAAQTAAENYAAQNRLSGYAGGEMPAGLRGMIVETGADDVPAS